MGRRVGSDLVWGPVTVSEATHPVRLGFLPEAQAIDDPDHPGLRRAGPRAAAPYGDDRVEFHRCPAVDLLRSDPGDLDLLGAGFDSVDLSGLEVLQQTCAAVLDAGRITDDQAAAIRASLDGAVLPAAHGPDLRVLHIADEGLIMRTGGPNGRSLVGPRSTGMNGHGQAVSIHVDQDVFGTPLEQVMDGRAPSLFAHESPDGANRDSTLLLVNLWIPLRQQVQPLVLADGRSVDRRRHQLRYGLPTGTFLERDEDQLVNDIYTLLHDTGQRWYFRSDMDHRSAWVFNTLSTPHGAGVLPGEDVAEQCFVALESLEEAVLAADEETLGAALSGVAGATLPADTPPALRSAVGEMFRLLDLVASDGPSEAWVEASRVARGRVVRSSLEMRMVVTVDPGRTA